MEAYKYKAIDKRGKIVKGLLYSQNENHMMNEIYNRKLILIDYKVSKSIQFKRLFNRVTFKDIAILAQQLSRILNSGVNISKGISMIYKQKMNCNLKASLKDIQQNINKGESIYDSLNQFPNIFPKFMRQMVRIGEESGNLDKTFQSISNYYMNRYILKKKVLGILSYPISVLIMTILISIFMIINIIPNFAMNIQQINGEMPQQMVGILAIKDIITSLRFKITIMIVVIAIVCLWKSGYFKDLTRVIKFKFPIIKKIYSQLLEIYIARSLYILIRSGVHIVYALEIIKDTYEESIIKNKIRKVIYKIRGGSNLAKALMEESIFNDLIISMIAIGEETENLEEMLESAIKISQEEVNDRLKKIPKIIGTISIVLLAGIIVYIILNILGPMINTIDSINNI